MKKFYEQLFYTLMDDCSKNGKTVHFNFLLFKIYNKGNWSLGKYFFKLKTHKIAKTTQILENSFFLKK